MLQHTRIIDGALDPKIKSPDSQARAFSVQIQDLNERYRLGEILGRGGNSTIVQAYDHQLMRTVALKILRIRKKERRHLAERRFYREACILSRLQHPGTVPVYDVGIIGENEMFYSMPVVRGATFRELTAEPADPQLRSLLTLITKAAAVVAYAHSQHIIHRDLKPENIMVDAYENILVMDWGLAKILDDAQDDADTPVMESSRFEPGEEDNLTMHGEISGTPAYMSPEQALGFRSLDPRSDVFALGIILFETIYGFNPFALKGERDYRRIFDKIKHSHPLLPRYDRFGARVSPELVAILEMCLEKQLDRRYPSAIELYEDLRRHLAFQHPLYAHTPAAGIVKSFIRRHRSPLTLITSSILALVFLSILIGQYRQLELIRSEDRSRLQSLLQQPLIAPAQKQSLRASIAAINSHRHIYSDADWATVSAMISQILRRHAPELINETLSP